MIELAPGLVYFPGFYARAEQEEMLVLLRAGVKAAPLFTPMRIFRPG